MKYHFNGRIAKFFREAGDSWMTASMVGEALHVETGLASRELGRCFRLDLLERRGNFHSYEYRGKPDVLNEKAPDHLLARKKHLSVDLVTAGFCDRWGVRKPFQATRRNPEALAEWCRLLESKPQGASR
jgi:hypothetical protein